MHVSLKAYEILEAALVAGERQVQAIRDNQRPAYGAKEKAEFQMHIDGVLGERAFAKAFGLYWQGKGDKRGDDVGPFQVRTTPYPWGDLCLHPEDDDCKRFFLLTGRNGEWDIRGWIFAREGKRPEYWRALPGHPDRPAFWVPQSALYPPPICFDPFSALIAIMQLQVLSLSTARAA